MLEKGLVQLYTAKGDELNFAPIGLALRAAGHNLCTHMTCFSPHEWMDGARMASTLLKPNLVIEHAHVGNKSSEGKWNDQEVQGIKQSFLRAQEALTEGDFDIVILNGLNRVLNPEIISSDEILELVKLKPDHVELIIAGLEAHEDLIEKADLVTEMICHTRKEPSAEKDNDHMAAPAEVVTGDGKGKTTYCLGKAMLMSCLGINSIFIQFIKSPKAYGEVKATRKLPYMDIRSMGEGFLNTEAGIPNKKHLEAARRAWEECLREIFSLKYGLVVMDEINLAAHYGFVHPQRMREMLFLKPQKLHLILSGRKADPEVRESSGTVIEMKEVKHPFKKGIKARKGIEF
jgi:cob(I)alamin adenosyltransferase